MITIRDNRCKIYNNVHFRAVDVTLLSSFTLVCFLHYSN